VVFQERLGGFRSPRFLASHLRCACRTFAIGPYRLIAGTRPSSATDSGRRRSPRSPGGRYLRTVRDVLPTGSWTRASKKGS